MFDKYMVCIVVWFCCVILWGLYCGGTFEGQATGSTLLLANVSTHVFLSQKYGGHHSVQIQGNIYYLT